MPVKQEDNSSPTASPLIDFTDQSATFLNQLATRKSKPVAAATLATWRSFIRTWIVPRIGNVELATFENLQLKDFADSMHQSGAKPGLISDVVALVKRIIKSARDSQGKRLFVRDWDSEFIDLPEVPPPDTYMPDAKTLQKAIRDADTNKVLQAMIVFAAGTGVRIGEIIACRIGPDDGQHTTWDPVTAII
jgi:integrase